MIELRTTDMAHGGEAVARVEGKAHFVEGALPGEVVRGEVVRDAGSWARVRLVEVVAAAAERTRPPCPYFAECGGCQWQFADYPAQAAWKRSILAGQLAHLGRIPDPPVRDTVVVGPEYRYRNRVDCDVLDGRPAFHRRRSHSLVAVEECLLLEPRLGAMLERLGDLRGVKRLTLRSSMTEGGLLAVVTGNPPPQAADWGAAVLARRGGGLRSLIGPDHIHETVAGVRLRITGDAFFQNNTPGAEALVRLAAEAVAVEPGETMLDGYAGGGLFGLTVGRSARRVVAVESDPMAVSDLRHNAANAPMTFDIVAEPFETALAGDRWDVAVVDPPRTGLGEAGVTALVGGRPRAIGYVSCDPASLARDTRLLLAAGYRLDWATPVDLFPQTFHIEAVAGFTHR